MASLTKKIAKKKHKRKRIYSKKEPYGYQPNNPLTIYYKKFIEKQ